MQDSVVTIDAEILSGEPVFTGTRVPVRNLIDYVAGGHTLVDFLEGFPGVTREQALSFLNRASKALVKSMESDSRAA